MKVLKVLILLALLVGIGAVAYQYATNRPTARPEGATGQVSGEAKQRPGEKPSGRKLELQEKYGFAPTEEH